MKSRSERLRPRLLVIGQGEHGKDEAAAILARRLSLAHISSSEFAGRRAVWPLVSDLYTDFAAAYADRRRHRDLWFHALAAYNLRPGPSLAEQLLEEHAIYVGLRGRPEFERARAMFDAVIWVDASERLGASVEPLDLGPGDADLVLDNNGTLEDLERNAAFIAALVGARWP